MNNTVQERAAPNVHIFCETAEGEGQRRIAQRQVQDLGIARE